MERTFNIIKEENEECCEETEGEVEEWIRNNRRRITASESIEHEDSPKIAVNSVIHILKVFKEKSRELTAFY